MKFYLQYGVPNLEPRVFLDATLHPAAEQMDEIEAKDWKEAREKVGTLPPAPPPKEGR